MRSQPLPPVASTVLVLLAACSGPPADEPSAVAPAAGEAAVIATPVAPTPDKWPASPTLQVAVLVAPGTDSPFRWDPVTPDPPRTRVENGAVWAPASVVIAAMKPGTAAEVVDGHLQVGALSMPARVDGDDAWVPVSELALALGGIARTNPVNGAVALWPAGTLEWLAAHGDPRAPVLAEARAAGVIE